MKLGIRFQMLIALTLTLGFGLLASFAVTSSVTTDALIDDHVTRLRHLAPLVASQLNTPQADRTRLKEALAPARLIRLKDSLRAHSRADASWTERLRPVAQAARDAKKLRDGFVTLPDGSAAVIVAFPVKEGVAVIISSLDPTRDRSEMLTRLLLLFTVVILALAIVPGYMILGRLVVQPLTRLVRYVERIGGGEFTQVHSAGPAPSEVGQLYRALDRMNLQLKKDRDQIRSQLDALTDAHATLQDTYERLVVSEKLATVGTLAAGVAHEIGNPIAVLQGYIELLQDPSLEASQRDTYVMAMRAAVDKVSAIITELLTFAKPVEAGGETCDVVEAAEAATRLARYPNLPKGITMHVEAPDGRVHAKISAGKLEQVLLNLLLNAAHASHKGGKIRIAIEEVADGVTLSVTDEGPGIPEDQLLKVFDPFFTTKDPGEGTGLGLAVCHHIITGHGGTITAGHAEPHGACFTLSLPTAAPPETSPPQRSVNP